MSDFPWKEVFQMGFAAVMALSLLYVLVKEVRGMRESHFESANKITEAVNAGAEKQATAMNQLSDAIKYAHNIAPPGMHIHQRSSDTPTPGIMQSPGATR